MAGESGASGKSRAGSLSRAETQRKDHQTASEFTSDLLSDGSKRASGSKGASGVVE